MWAQQILIEIGLHCIKYIDWVEEELKNYYNDTLDKIYHRHELRIQSMQFTEETRNNKVKIKIGLDMAYFMYKTLEYCIMKIDRKSVDFYRQDFISFFIALAYIWIEDFKITFEAIILKKGFV